MLSKTHRLVGAAIALPVLVQATTGSLLVFEGEIDAWLNSEHFRVTPQSETLSVQAQFDAFVTEHPDMEEHVYIMRFPAAPDEATVMLAKPYDEIGPRRGVRFFVNPYTGDVSNGQPYHTTLMGKVYNLHRTLWLPRWGRWLTSTSAILTAMLAFSGIVLAVSRFFSRGAEQDSAWLRLHRRLGLSVAPLVAVIALNGAAVTYLFVVIPLLYIATGTEMPEEMKQQRSTQVSEQEGVPRASLDRVIASAQSAYPEADPRVFLQPSVADTAITVVLRKPHEPRAEGGTFVAVHPQTAEALRTNDYTDGGLGNQAVYWLIHLHKGTWGGYFWGDRGKLATRIVWVFAAASAAIVAATGGYAWLSGCRRLSDEPLVRRPIEA